MDFVPCVKWVSKGLARASPEKVELTREELQQIIFEAQPEDSDNEMPSSNQGEGTDMYDFDNYDLEEENYSNSLGIGSLALYEENPRDPHVNIPGMDEEDTDDEDDQLNSDDNLIIVGKGFRDSSSMENIEIYVYNEETSDLFVHHDIMVESCPLSLEVITIETDDRPCGFIAAGLMSSSIHLYDINVINPVKPQAKLGSKKKHVKKGHTNAVLDLSWNSQYSHILASSSADKTVALWDLETASLSNKFDFFTSGVENIHWSSESAHCLLCCDSSGCIKLIDCRLCSSVKDWTVKGEALIGRWTAEDTNRFLVGTSKGKLYCFDLRTGSHVFKIKAHDSDITGVSSIHGYNNLVVTSCVNGDLCIWDVNANPKKVVYNKSINIEQLHTLALNPDNPLTAAVGGAKKKGSYFSVINMNKNNCLGPILNFHRTSQT